MGFFSKVGKIGLIATTSPLSLGYNVVKDSLTNVGAGIKVEPSFGILISPITAISGGLSGVVNTIKNTADAIIQVAKHDIPVGDTINTNFNGKWGARLSDEGLNKVHENLAERKGFTIQGVRQENGEIGIRVDVYDLKKTQESLKSMYDYTGIKVPDTGEKFYINNKEAFYEALGACEDTKIDNEFMWAKVQDITPHDDSQHIEFVFHVKKEQDISETSLPNENVLNQAKDNQKNTDKNNSQDIDNQMSSHRDKLLNKREQQGIQNTGPSI